MKIIGIIAEYNPFHNGHLYHINKCKELYPNSLIILILNGYITQRGEISILSKEEKTTLALKYGVDIILELPFVFGCQSADIFALNSIKILNEFKIDILIFGSESNNIKDLKTYAKYQLNDDFEQNLKEKLKTNISYPKAIANSIKIQKKIIQPNDLLGVSYIKAIMQVNPKIKVKTIQRTNNYHDLESNTDIISASNIRKKLKEKIDIIKFIPDYQIKFINNDYFLFLKYKIITEDNLSSFLTVNEEMNYRLKKYINVSSSLTELIQNIKTKRWTYNKLNRAFMHILVGLKKEDITTINLDYIRVLGFNTLGKEYLHKIKKKITIPLLNSKSKSLAYKYELKAALIYDLLTNSSSIKFEQRRIPIIY